MRRDGNKVLVMLPLVAKGQSIGLVELISDGRSPGTTSGSSWPGRWPTRRRWPSRTRGSTRTPASCADRDPLTGFYNHRFLHERLGEEVVRAQRGRRPLSVLMLDLDDFKLVNDTFGHLFGDRVLVWTARAHPLDAARHRTSRPATAATSSR